MLRDDMDAYRAKAEIISSAEVFHKKFAIAVGRDLTIESPTIIGAQAADELLDINGIKASFVLTVYNGRIYISARSIDEVNVQIIMELLWRGRTHECVRCPVRSHRRGCGSSGVETGAG